MLTALRLRLKYFRDEISAVAAIEFAMIVPLLVFFMVVEFDVYRYVMATQRLEIIAASVGQMFASATASPNAITTGNGVVGDNDISFYTNSTYFVYPDMLTSPAMLQGTPWWRTVFVDAAGIKMVQAPGGTYKPVVVWHAANGVSANTRQCNTTFSVNSNTSVTSPDTLPAGAIGPNSLIVVDVQSTFQPTFGSYFMSPLNIVRSVYVTPRNVPFVEYQGSGSMATNC